MKTLNAESREWDELAQQLLTLPGGGPAAILSDYFGATARPIEPHFSELERWALSEGGSLSLEVSGALVFIDATGPSLVITRHAPFTRVTGLSPMALMLTALVGGTVEGDAALKQHAPKTRRAAKELLLVASCRLCG
ncbi:MAG: hypothetical protein D4R70_04535 [Betaproteobacteria bacterium]|nr:MAG: hypothetical protein D4R70_04535 [Betaproteobacteria bacterium]